MKLNNIKTERSSITLWVALSLPVLITMFLFLFLRINGMYDGRKYLQNVGDLSSRAAISKVDIGSMLTIPAGEEEPQPQIDETEAISIAQQYLKNNLSLNKNMFTADVNTLIDNNSLSVDETSFQPNSATDEGVAIKVLNNSSYINPITGEAVTSPSVLIVMQFKLALIFGPKIITTYSIASI